MAWIQLLLFSCLSLTPLTTLSHTVFVDDIDVDVVDDDEDDDDDGIICKGIDEELNSCNMKLTEKTDYSFNIEKDLFALKDQLRMIKLSCINASQASSVQVAALQNQLDNMLKQLGEKALGPAGAVLNILQEYVKAQKLELDLLVETDPKKIAEMQEQLKKSRADLEALGGNLNQLECQTANNSQQFEEELSKESERISELLGRNKYLEEKISDTQAECSDLQENYNELVDKLELTGTDSTMKSILDIVSLDIGINNLEDRIRSETSESKRTELEKELREKKEQLESKKKELQTSDDLNTRIILTILSKLEEMRKLQSQILDGDSLDQIKEKKEEVLRLLSELDDSNLAKTVLKNLVLLSDETHLKKLISNIKQKADKQIAELQEEVRKKEEELKRKTTELGKKDSDVATLTKEVRDLREELKNLTKQVRDVENASASRLGELEKQLKETRQELEEGNKALQEKDADLAKKVIKITELLEELRQTKEEANRRNQEAANRITDLEGKLKKEEGENKNLRDALKEATECADLKKSYNRLKADFDKTVSKLNDTLINQVFTIEALKQDIKKLEDEVSSAEGNVEELNQRLQEKKAELEEAKNKIKKHRGESLKFLKLLEELRKVNRKQEEHIQEYLVEINRLEKDMEEMLARLSATGNEKSKLAIQVIFLKEEVSQLTKGLAGLRKEHQEKTAGLEEEIEEKNKEIAYLKRSGCVYQISDLQQELRVKQQELEQLKRENSAQIRELQKKLTEKTRKLEETAVELKDRDSENANLINQLTDLNEQLNKALEDRKEGSETAQKRISELKEQLKKKEQELSHLSDSNAECEEQLKQKQKQVSDLNNENAELEEQLKKKGKELSKLENNNAELEEQLKKKEKELSNLKNNNADLEEQLKQKDKELSDLKNNNAGVNDERERLQKEVKRLKEQVKAAEQLEEQLKQKERELSKLKNSNAELEEQLKQKEKELSNLKNNNADVINENERLRGDVKRLNNRVKVLENSEEQLKQKEKEISDLKKNNAKVIDENKRLQVDVMKLKERVKELEGPVTVKPPTVTIMSLEFDPQTAHRRLLISADERSVRGVQYTIARYDSPRRYDTAIAALTKTGFNSGRPYWEVQVKDRSCFVVGVAAESAPRKGEIRYRPSNGYWTIQKENGQHYMLAEHPVRLRLSDKLNIIGILIDFSSGEVVFYNAQTRAVLYTFSRNKFTQKLYPYVATCGSEGPEDWPIELLDTALVPWLN
ncbi:putative leucine-rich repeat-containing protein DDB_G0290503 isoform X2 [Ictalurus punctatus]|uniref:Leucine-rich repeat-containing protein DDB_G0290503 isoform X2 n=1 Tax=Ictalurus punctatus TaxID=7998 RepID=A0A2D0Q314_ICTPU|nr:putative leucine-rich repeat-containing protein DDB_G0290503 isoform X2 [Ictalurus punctatus]